MQRQAPLGRAGGRVTRLAPALIVGMVLIGLVAFAGGSVFLTASPETSPVGADIPASTADTFEHAPASISITAVGPVDNETAVEQPTTTATIRPNETTSIRGETNLAPDDNVVIVELRTETGTFIASNTTDEWGADGAWSTALNTSELTPGTYVLEVETTETTDQVDVVVVPSDSASTATSETHSTEATTQSNTTSTEAKTTVTTAEEPSTNGSTAVTEAGGSDADGGSTNATATAEESDLSTPGFGFLTALVAVVIVSAVVLTRG